MQGRQKEYKFCLRSHAALHQNQHRNHYAITIKEMVELEIKLECALIMVPHGIIKNSWAIF